ncbi:MAG: hypothetical protein IT302_01255 [Dehalococcoidia bacterium]|nr:hypothetical protein [Dehalococcoidia bacterium]
MRYPVPITGPRYITDSKGRRTAVVLSIREYNQLLEDSHDRALMAESRGDERIPWEDVKRELKERGLLPD